MNVTPTVEQVEQNKNKNAYCKKKFYNNSAFLFAILLAEWTEGTGD